MHIAIVDDARADRTALCELLQDCLRELGFPGAKLDLFLDGSALLRAYAPGVYDLLLLDIFMKPVGGVALARRLRETDAKVLIAFCSTSNEFASESYEVSALGYILKPVQREKLMALLRRAVEIQGMSQEKITLPDGQSVFLAQIIYTEFFRHYITFHLKDGTQVVSRMNQSELEQLLAPYSYFYSSSRGNIVNLYEVRCVEQSGSLRMKNGSLLPVPYRRIGAVSEAFASFCFQKTRKEMS